MARGMKEERWVTLRVEEIKKETDKAFCIKIEDHGPDVWLPKSQMREPDNFCDGEADCEIEVSEWIAQQKNLPTNY